MTFLILQKMLIKRKLKPSIEGLYSKRIQIKIGAILWQLKNLYSLIKLIKL